MKPRILILTGLTLMICLISGCGRKQGLPDASGTFEATEVMIPAEVGGVLTALHIMEGMHLIVGDTIGLIDTIPLSLKKRQLKGQVNALLGRRPDIGLQLAALQEQLEQTVRDQQRIKALFAADAATKKQLDDITTQIAVIERQINAQRSSLEISSDALAKETVPVFAQLDQVEDQIRRSILINPVEGTVLVKYANAHEMAVPGKALYKIADITALILRAFISGDQLEQVKLGQEVKVVTSGPEGTGRTYSGTIEWISDEAEFTPKTIQTRNERANLVYAMKIRVNNDGYLKIGMYGDVIF
jgi:HlyD family secretion protein